MSAGRLDRRCTTDANTGDSTVKRIHLPLLPALCLAVALALVAAPGAVPETLAAGQTVIVSAEGLADPNADAYKRDKALMVEDLRRDAKSQVIEKAVGALVSSSTLMENYALIHDRVLTRSAGLIKRVIKESPPWVGEDGFAHMLMKAEVYVDDVQNALRDMSKTERIALIKEYGNPKISTSVMVQSGDDPSGEPRRSSLAENLLNERLKSFGYRVWSEDHSLELRSELMVRSKMDNQVETTLSLQAQRAADFYIQGVAKLKRFTHTLQPANITVTKYTLSYFSVKCVNAHTGEEILYNNQIPRNKSWADEAHAIEDVGRLIGGEFSQEFFAEHLQAPSHIFQLQVFGLPSYDMGQLLKKEFIGMRPVLNVDFRNFDRAGASLYEVEFTGGQENFSQLLNSAVITPLNQKLGERAFVLDSAHGEAVRVTYQSSMTPEELQSRLEKTPPASLASASPERIRDVVKSEETLAKVAEVAPAAAKKLSDEGILDSSEAQSAVQNF